jgi:ornithine decarboxylase
MSLDRLGVGFEIASANELRRLSAIGVGAGRMICLHPVKSLGFLSDLHRAGVTLLAADSPEEIRKIATFAPGSRVVIRVDLEGMESKVPLGRKFGCRPSELAQLSHYADRLGTRPVGFTIHVGSQCESLCSWARAMSLCTEMCDDVSQAGFRPEIISLGGGLPVAYTETVPRLEAIGEIVSRANLHRFGSQDRVVSIEPGRAIVATTGTLFVTVVGTAVRQGIRWIYLDAGTHHGLFETLTAAGGLSLPVISENAEGALSTCRLAGPTCDSYDTLPGLYRLPEPRVGDRLAFLYAGAYSTAVASDFNGFDRPGTLFFDSEEAGQK